MNIIFESLDIDPVIYFLGAPEEIEKAEAKEAARAAEIEIIIFSPGFQQLTYKTAAGAIRSLHRSTRQGVKYQLSYIDPDGVPAMHENYIKTGTVYGVGAIHDKRDLLQHYINATLKNSIALDITIDC